MSPLRSAARSELPPPAPPAEPTGGVRRVRTYVEGFDKILGGGVPRGHSVLLAGTAGTMKSSLAFYVLHRNAVEEKVPGAYVSLEQSKDTLIPHFRGLELDPEAVADRVSLVDLGRIRIDAHSIDPGKRWDMEMVRRYIESLKEERSIQLLVLDSLTGYLTIMEQMGEQRGDSRMALFEFFDWLHGLDVTSFLISEMASDTRAYSRFGSDFLADGVVHLELEVPDNTHARRRIRCVKMRGSDHSLDYYALIYGGGRFRVPSSDVWR